jgi:hypothetical protein
MRRAGAPAEVVTGGWWAVALVAAFGWGGFGEARASDAQFYGVIKSHQFVQAAGGTPQLIPDTPFAFNAFVLNTTNYAVTNATVKPPGSLPLRTLGFETNGIALRYEERFATLGALDAAFPSSGSIFGPSTYTVNMATVHDGLQSPKVSYLLVTTPRTPELTNLPDAQRIDATRDFQLRWASLDGTALDIVQVLVTDASSNLWFSSAAPFQDGALNGTHTAVIIPAGQLPPGRALDGHLTIARPGLPNTNTYPGAIGIAALAKDTAFTLATLPAVPPVLEVQSTNNQPFRLGFAGESNRVYYITATTNLGAAVTNRAHWLRLATTHSPTGKGVFADPESPAIPARWYRIEVGP